MPRMTTTSLTGSRNTKTFRARTTCRLAVFATVTLAAFGTAARAQSVNVPTQVALSVSSNGAPVGTVASGAQVTLTATATTSGNPLTFGVIQFCDTTGPSCPEGQSLGTIDIPATGAATVTYIPPVGSHHYVAYLLSNSSANQTVSSTSPLTVSPPTVNVPASDFSLGMFPGTTSTQTLPAGTEETTFNFVVTPVGGTTIPPITVTTSGLEQSVIATLTPQTMASGSAAVSVQMALNWGNVVAMERRERFKKDIAPIALSFLLLPFAGLLKKSRSRFARLACVLFLSVAGLGAISGLTGCATANSPSFHNATITATSGSVSHSMTVSYWNGF